MLNFWSKSRRGAIGLDIGSEGVRAIQLAAAGRTFEVVAAGRWHAPPDLSAGDAATQAKAIAAGVREAVDSNGFRGKDVVSCLRCEELAIKNIRLPHASDAELAETAAAECRERFGFEVVPDRMFMVNAGEVRQGAEVRDEVLLMAAKEETINAHLARLDQMRLRPVHIDAEPMAVFRTYQRFLRRVADATAVTVVVDIGLSSTKVLIARGRAPLLIKSLDIAGSTFNQAVARHLNISYGEAAHARRRHLRRDEQPSEPQGEADWTVIDAIREQVEALSREVALCLRYCSVTFRGLRPTKVTVTGGEAYDPAVLKLLGQNLDCECVVGQPLAGVQLGQANLGSDRRSELTEWSVATGLALWGLMRPAPTEDGTVEHEPARVSA